MASCDVKTGACESSSSAPGECTKTACESKCMCGGGCGGDPVTCATLSWKCAFKEAYREALVDALKPKIQKAFGAKLDKAADAVLAAMTVKWQSMLAVEEAKCELKDKLRDIMTEGK